MKQIISTDKAPGAIGPYSQAVRAGDFLFCSGQIAIDPETGKLIEGDVAAQTRQVMENLRAVLEAAGMDFSHVVKTTIFLSSMDHFATVNEIYGSYFPSDPPARATVAVATLPKNVDVEIEVIAYGG